MALTGGVPEKRGGLAAPEPLKAAARADSRPPKEVAGILDLSLPASGSTV